MSGSVNPVLYFWLPGSFVKGGHVSIAIGHLYLSHRPFDEKSLDLDGVPVASDRTLAVDAGRFGPPDYRLAIPTTYVSVEPMKRFIEYALKGINGHHAAKVLLPIYGRHYSAPERFSRRYTLHRPITALSSKTVGRRSDALTAVVDCLTCGVSPDWPDFRRHLDAELTPSGLLAALEYLLQIRREQTESMGLMR